MSQQNKSKNQKSLEKALDDELKGEVRSVRDGSRKELSEPIKRYLKALVDTKNAKPTHVPYLDGGMALRSRSFKIKVEGKFSIGTNGLGYMTIPNPDTSLASGGTGPFSTTVACTTTLPGYTGTNIGQYATILSANHANYTWPSAYDPTGYKGGDMEFRTVGMTVEVFPESSFSSQNGALYLHEVPDHVLLNWSTTSLPISDIQTHQTTRVLRATQTGPQSEKIVLNWHPQAHAYTEGATADQNQYSMNDFDFKPALTFLGSGFRSPANGLVIVAEGAASTSFHFTLTGMFEVRGRLVRGLKGRTVDSRGMDLVSNTLARKTISGYVGNPEHVYESYLWKAWDSAKALGRWGWNHKKEISDSATAAFNALGGFL